uniref:Ovule protein n=1 Tax=Heterorhabditis bacteriophora TaxID=37862 RepID=A0A1I7X7W9_HETBA
MSCLMWQNLCDKTGACPIYDTDELRISIFRISSILAESGRLPILSIMNPTYFTSDKAKVDLFKPDFCDPFPSVTSISMCLRFHSMETTNRPRI